MAAADQEGTWAQRVEGAERVCFVGDAHGDTGFLASVVRWAAERSCADVERCFQAIDEGPVDLVLSHDAPLEVPLGPLTPWPPGDAHRRILSAIGARAKPRHWFAGHYHRRVSAAIEFRSMPCAAEVLSCNGQGDRARLLIEAGDLAAAPPTPLRPTRSDATSG